MKNREDKCSRKQKCRGQTEHCNQKTLNWRFNGNRLEIGGKEHENQNFIHHLHINHNDQLHSQKVLSLKTFDRRNQKDIWRYQSFLNRKNEFVWEKYHCLTKWFWQWRSRFNVQFRTLFRKFLFILRWNIIRCRTWKRRIKRRFHHQFSFWKCWGWHT